MFIKLREGCTLGTLSASQQEQLFDWLELYSPKIVLEMVAAPPPDGFGLKTHLTSLRRFHERARTCFHRDLTTSSLQLLPGQASDPNTLDQLTTVALRQFAVEMASVQERNPARFATVSRWVLRLQQNAQRDREIKVIEERIALEKRKFEFNAARAALLHICKIKEVILEHPGDNEDKIWAIRDEMFGSRSDLVENPNLQSTHSAKGNSSQPRTAGFQPAAAPQTS
jgi:hypothetical protein